MAKKFYITNAIPYVNAPPHLGHALEFVQTDFFARVHRALEEDVFYLSGADENSLKNVLAAREKDISVEKLVTENMQRFEALREPLNLSYNDFIHTSDRERHWPGARKLWKSCVESGDVYKKKYRGLYCVGCEEFKTEKDLIDGKCPEHDADLEVVEEENYFFRLSRYQEQLEEIIFSDKYQIVPEAKKNEVLAFIRSGLEDFSISRSVERAHGWGIPVPGDDSQIMYVWFDALANYITALGYAENAPKFKEYWPADLHIIGKGITRFHAIYWPAMLLSAGLSLPKKLFVHGYITVEGEKISKSLGNAVDPQEIISQYNTVAVRYYLLRAFSPFGDGDFSRSELKAVYNADLANGFGNLVARVGALCEKANFSPSISKLSFSECLSSEMEEALEKLAINIYLEKVKEEVTDLNHYVDKKKPWELLDDNSSEELKTTLTYLVEGIYRVALLIRPATPKAVSPFFTQDAEFSFPVEEILFPRMD